MTEMIMWTFTCTTENCTENGIDKPIDWDAIQEANAASDPPVQTGPVICGVCGADITESGVDQSPPK